MSKQQSRTKQQPKRTTTGKAKKLPTPKRTRGRAQADLTPPHQEQDIAIIGMACRFPGADDWQTLWENLKAGTDSVVEIPDGRWPATEEWYHLNPAQPNKAYIRCGGFLKRVDEFDAPFFKIPPVEAMVMDPQQRIFLEEAYHAIEDAGLDPEQLKGQSCGVFVGVGQSGYTLLLAEAEKLESRYAITGLDLSTLAARIAYFLDLQGPAIALNTACSSSLLAIHQACESIRTGEIDLALAGGITIYTTPLFHVQASQFKMLSAQGRCKPFDAGANGFVPSEGCGVLLLKQAAKALADGDRIYAVIKGSGVNQDGSTNGITAPSARAQTRLEKRVYERHAIDPSTIGYVEAHGTGTALGDPIEISALTEAFADYTDQKQFCAIGSIKSNLGHPIQAAGVAGVIKAALCVQWGELPPSLHFTTPNPHIDFAATPFYVNTHLQAWPAPADHPRRAAVSAFGISGTNAHLVLEDAPQETRAGNGKERPHQLFTLSAKSDEALQAYIRSYQAFLSAQPELDLGDLCYTGHVGRSHFAHRFSVVADSVSALQQQLATYSNSQSSSASARGTWLPGQAVPTVAFLFTGQGAQYAQMGRELYETSPTFRTTLDRCEEIFRQETGASLLAILFPEESVQSDGRTVDQPAAGIDDTTYTQPALFVLEVALARLWQSWGIQPTALVGHSIGELAAACVAGVFSLEDGVKLVAARGRLMGALPQDGEMISLMVDETQARQAIAPYENEVSIAAVNGPASIVIAGKREAVLTIAEQLAAEGVKTRKLTVSHAFHSPLMEPMLDDFAKVAQSITYHQPQIPIVSNITGKLTTDPLATVQLTDWQYWVRHVREAVRFADGITTLYEEGNITAFLEIGPKPILTGMAQTILDAIVTTPETAASLPLLLSSLHHKRGDWRQLLTSLGELYVRGTAVDWRGFDQDTTRQRIALPTYPFQRKRFWVERQPAQVHGTVPTDGAMPINGRGPVQQDAPYRHVEQPFTVGVPLPQPTDMVDHKPMLLPKAPADSNTGVEQVAWNEAHQAHESEGDGLMLEIDEIKGLHFSIQLDGEDA